MRSVDWRVWGRDGIASHPYAPRTVDDVPAGAFEALRNACGVGELDDLFVVPKNVRKSSYGPRSDVIVTPTHVLGAGSMGVGLWVGEPHDAVVEVVHYERLCAIELVSVLLYGRLRFVADRGALTMRFNTVARPELERLIFRARERVAGRPLPVPPGEGPEAARLPFKWNLIATSKFLALDETAPVAVAFVRARTAGRGRAVHANLLALTPFELAFLHEPYDSDQNYGVDGVYFPRSRIQALRFDEERITCVVEGRRFVTSAPRPLIEAAYRWFSRVNGEE